MANSVDDKAKLNSCTLSVTATPAKSGEQHVLSWDEEVILRDMSHQLLVPMPSELHSDTDFIIWCPPEHLTHPALDKLGLVIVGQTDEGVMAMERTSLTEW